MSPISLFFSCATRLWCILWKSRSFRNLSHVADAFAAISLALFSSRRSAETSSSRSCQENNPAYGHSQDTLMQMHPHMQHHS